MDTLFELKTQWFDPNGIPLSLDGMTLDKQIGNACAVAIGILPTKAKRETKKELCDWMQDGCRKEKLQLPPVTTTSRAVEKDAAIPDYTCSLLTPDGRAEIPADYCHKDCAIIYKCEKRKTAPLPNELFYETAPNILHKRLQSVPASRTVLRKNYAIRRPHPTNNALFELLIPGHMI
ncbi:uncharacterized protein LOC144063842 [Vanacampus margaritifer]